MFNQFFLILVGVYLGQEYQLPNVKFFLLKIIDLAQKQINVQNSKETVNFFWSWIFK